MSACHHNPSGGPARHGDVVFNGATLTETQMMLAKFANKAACNVMEKWFCWTDPTIATVPSTVGPKKHVPANKTGGENDFLRCCARWWAFVCARQTGFKSLTAGFTNKKITAGNERICSADDKTRMSHRLSDTPLHIVAHIWYDVHTSIIFIGMTAPFMWLCTTCEFHQIYLVSHC